MQSMCSVNKHCVTFNDLISPSLLQSKNCRPRRGEYNVYSTFQGRYLKFVMLRDIQNIGAICCDPRSGIDKYSPTNERKNRVKNTRWRSHRVFFTRFFLEFGVNIWNSAERSSAYCHYSSFFVRHNQQWWIPANTIITSLSTVALKNVE